VKTDFVKTNVPIAVSSPDKNSSGLLQSEPNALRYDNLSLDPDDAAMKLAGLITSGSRILDVGCGTGVITELIRNQKSASIIGIEPDEERVKRAIARGLDVHLGVLSSEFIQRHGPFDYVIFADVLEHLPNPAEIVKIAKTGLKPGGSVVASVPNVAHWFVRVDLLAGRFDYQNCGIMDATHLRWFTRRTIREFFERLGFHVAALDCTLNIDLRDYKYRIPWRWMSPRLRRRVVGKLTAWRPGLFGCQHIVRATLPK
jgi:methionine biosynthesis protein MetW